MYDRKLRADIKLVQTLGFGKHKSKSIVGQLKAMDEAEREKLIGKLLRGDGYGENMETRHRPKNNA